MYMYSCIFLKISSSSFSLNDKIPHQYVTHANIKKRMAEEDQRYVKVQGKIDEIRVNISKIMEIIQAMALAKEAST